MKYFILFSIFILSGFTGIIAQSNFKEGYIVKNNGDTVYGYIEYRGNSTSAKICTFKKEVDANRQIFTPKNLKSYKFIDGKYYVSKYNDSKDDQELLFLEYLINGIVDIYYYRDDKGEHYLVDRGDDKTRELVGGEKEYIVDNKRYVRESKEYIGALKYIFKDSPRTVRQVDEVTLNHGSLIRITRNYHNEVCKGEDCIVYEKEGREFISHFGILVGLNYMVTQIVGNVPEEYYYLNSNFDAVTYPSFGLFWYFSAPPLNKNLFIRIEGSVSTGIELKGHSVYIDPADTSIHINDIRYKSISPSKLAISFQYEFTQWKLRPFIYTGLFNSSYGLAYYKRDLEVKLPWGETYLTKEENKNPFSNLDFGFTIGAGFKYSILKRSALLLDFRYQRGFGMIDFMNTDYYALYIGYQFL